MIKRIVMMELLPGGEALFLDIFEQVKKDIRAQEGCLGLEVLREEVNGQISVWTISVWESSEELDRYRSSTLFQRTWARVKPLFAARARAWSLTSIEQIA